jgi:hypothetical protein
MCLALAGKGWQSVRSLEMELVSNNDDLDVSLIRCVRLVTAEYVLSHQNEDVGTNGIVLKDIIMAVYHDCRFVLLYPFSRFGYFVLYFLCPGM